MQSITVTSSKFSLWMMYLGCRLCRTKNLVLPALRPPPSCKPFSSMLSIFRCSDGRRGITIFSIFKTYNPLAFSEVEKVMQCLHCHNRDLWPNSLEPIWPWQNQTLNQQSATTFSYNHRDINNYTKKWCSMQAGGRFKYKEGGQLVLHEYRLIIELQPGQLRLFPSALITHCNIPLQPGDEHYSIVLYSSGGSY